MYKNQKDGDQSFTQKKPLATATMESVYEGPQTLKSDYHQKYKSLEQQTINRLNILESAKQENSNEMQFYQVENRKFQQYFDKVLNDNKILYMRCKELEQQLAETNPAYKTQYQSIIQENEELRQQNQLLQDENTAAAIADHQTAHGIRPSNKLLSMQREIEDLKREQYDLRLRLQSQIQNNGNPHSRVYLGTPTPVTKVEPIKYSSPINAISMQPTDNYCDSILSSNEKHNRAVLERCRSIVQSHSYY